MHASGILCGVSVGHELAGFSRVRWDGGEALGSLTYFHVVFSPSASMAATAAALGAGKEVALTSWQGWRRHAECNMLHSRSLTQTCIRFARHQQSAGAVSGSLNAGGEARSPTTMGPGGEEAFWISAGQAAGLGRPRAGGEIHAPHQLLLQCRACQSRLSRCKMPCPPLLPAVGAMIGMTAIGAGLVRRAVENGVGGHVAGQNEC